MNKFHRNITVIIYLLKKLHNHAKLKQVQLYQNLSKNENYILDCRITAFGLLRTIIFCAVNDAYNLKYNIDKKTYLLIKTDLGEVFDDPFMRLAIENYPIYNYIIRFQSLIETCTRKFLLKLEFKKYLSELDSTKKNAVNILYDWRNTIHNNGCIEKEKIYNYRGREILIPKDKSFEFDFWILYRISFDLIDVLFELSKKSFQKIPDLLIDYQANTKRGL